MEKSLMKLLSVLKVIGAVYGIMLLMVSIVYFIDAQFPNSGPYAYMSDQLGNIVGDMWAFPFMVFIFTMLGYAFICPILLREMKKLNTREQTWIAPVWIANVVISVLLIVPGGFILGLFNHFVYETPRGPWNLIPMIFLGYIFLHVAHSASRKFIPTQLEWAVKKMFG